MDCVNGHTNESFWELVLCVDAQCVLVARTQGGLEEVDDAIRAAGGKSATLLPFDLQNAEKDIDMIGPSIVERFGRLDILVHNAGALNKLTPVAHIEPRDWAEVMAVKLAAVVPVVMAGDDGGHDGNSDDGGRRWRRRWW